MPEPKPTYLAWRDDCVEVWKNRPEVKEPVAQFFGPDDDANARKFMHMDELVEVARLFLDDAFLHKASHTIDPHGGERDTRLRTILAKIDGKP